MKAAQTLLVAVIVSLVATPARGEWAEALVVSRDVATTQALQSAERLVAKGQVNDAAGLVADTLRLPAETMIGGESGSVRLGRFISEWLGQLPNEQQRALTKAIRQRVGSLKRDHHWDDVATRDQLARALRIAVDLGDDDRARDLASRLRMLGSLSREQATWLKEFAPKTPPPSPAPDATGWSLPLNDGPERLSTRTLLDIREFGFVPRLATAPTEDGDDVFVRGLRSLSRYRVADGQRVWKQPLPTIGAGDLSELECAFQSLLLTALGSPVAFGDRVVLVEPTRHFFGQSQSLSRGSTVLRCRTREDGTIRWEQFREIESTVLGGPVACGGLWWVPVRTGTGLSVFALAPDSGDVVREFPLTALQTAGDRLWRHGFAAPITTSAGHVFVAFDDGLIACFDGLNRRLEWTHVVESADRNHHVWVAPLAVRRDQRPNVPRPQLQLDRAQIVVQGQTVTATCPRWTMPVSLSRQNGAPVNTAAPKLDTVSRVDNGLIWRDGQTTRRFSIGAGAKWTQTPIARRPFSITSGRHIWVQTETTLRRLGRDDFVTSPQPTFAESRQTHANVFQKQFLSAPITTLFGSFSTRRPLCYDDGTSAFAGPPWLPRPVATPPPPPPRWGPEVTVSVQAEPFLGPVPAVLSFPVENCRLDDDLAVGPQTIAVSSFDMGRTQVALRVDGYSLPPVTLPGQNGNDRHDTSVSRAWLIGDSVVLQLGRELFGLRLEPTGVSTQPWRAAVVWPSDGGFLTTPARYSLLGVPRFRELDTPAGPMLQADDGRLCGNVAVVGRTVAVRRNATLFLLDAIYGRIVARHDRRRPSEVVVAGTDNFWLVELSDGSAVRVDRETGQLQDSLPRTDGALLSVGVTGRWTFDDRDRLMTRFRWDGEVETYFCERPEHVFFGRHGVALWDSRARRARLFADSGPNDLADSGPTHLADFGPTREYTTDQSGRVTSVQLIETPDTWLLGLSGPVVSPGLLDAPQVSRDLRPLFDGVLIALDAQDLGRERWRKQVGPVALPLVQPSDAPVVQIDWNEKMTRADGKLNSLHTTQLQLLDRRTGEELLRQSANRPIAPKLSIDSGATRIGVSHDNRWTELQFHEPNQPP